MRVSGRALRLLALAGGFGACRAEPGATETPGRTSDGASTERPAIAADRGVVYGSDEVRIRASWRSDVDPRGAVIVFSGDASESAIIANRVLDAGFNVAVVESASRSIAHRLEVAATITNDKSLSQRQRLEQGRPRQPAVNVFWLDASEGEGVIDLLRAQPPFRVHAAVVLTREGPPRRLAFASESAGEIRVLAVPAPLDDAAWMEILRFVEDVVQDLLGERPAPPRDR